MESILLIHKTQQKPSKYFHSTEDLNSSLTKMLAKYKDLYICWQRIVLLGFGFESNMPFS